MSTELAYPLRYWNSPQRNNALSLTIPTSPGWDNDYITFEGRDDLLPNLWGQQDLTHIMDYYANSLQDAHERFASRYTAAYCAGALNDAPERGLWENYGFFRSMDKARERKYHVDDHIIKSVGNAKYGPLLELRCYGSGWRVFITEIDCAEIPPVSSPKKSSGQLAIFPNKSISSGSRLTGNNRLERFSFCASDTAVPAFLARASKP